MELKCRQCNTFFTQKNKRQVYCSSKCRTKACRVRHGKGKLSDLVQQESTNSKYINKKELLTASMGSVIGNTFHEMTNPKATFIAQRRIEAKQDLLLDKVENLEINQYDISRAINSNENTKERVILYPTVPRRIKAQRDPRMKKRSEIEVEESWIDRNFVWVAPVAVIGFIYVAFKLIPDRKQNNQKVA